MADTEQYDPYDLAEGSPLGEGRVTINGASFGYDAGYKNGEAELMIFEGSVLDGDGEAHDWRKFYSLGAGWQIVDGGARVQRADGKVKNFQKQSKYGLFLSAALSVGAGDTLRQRGTPMEAAIWTGLVFDVESKDQDYGGEIGKKSTLVPTAFHGTAGSPSTPSAPSAAASSADSPAASGSGSSTTSAVSGKVKVALRKLAKECGTHEEFVDRAFVEVDGVDGNPAVESAVADNADLYNELSG